MNGPTPRQDTQPGRHNPERRRARTATPRGHPSRRGEQFTAATLPNANMGPSPRVRRAALPALAYVEFFGTIPARAGSRPRWGGTS